MTLELKPEEVEFLYFALNDYALKYIHASRTWATSDGKDYAQKKAEKVGLLQVKVGDLFLKNTNTTHTL